MYNKMQMEEKKTIDHTDETLTSSYSVLLSSPFAG